MRKSLNVMGAAALVALACTSQEGRPSDRGEVFSEHRFLTANRPTKKLGEDCTVSGKSECETAVCYHVKPHPAEGYICSASCQSDDDCPETWNCRAMLPGATFCVPPDGWSPQKTVVRPRAPLKVKSGGTP